MFRSVFNENAGLELYEAASLVIYSGSFSIVCKFSGCLAICLVLVSAFVSFLFAMLNA